MAEVGWFPLFFNVMIKYWIKQVDLDNTLLEEALYLIQTLHDKKMFV